MRIYSAIYLLLLILLSSCATSMLEVDRDVGSGQPPEYKIGYQNGCDSGVAAADNPYYRFKKDVYRYKSDDLYKQGWDDGFNVCKGKYEATKGYLRR
jgi:hypothetical protein